MVVKKRILVESVVHDMEQHLREKGYSPVTLKQFRTVWNRFVRYAEKRKRKWFSIRMADEFRGFAAIPEYGVARRRGRINMARTAMRLLCDFAETGACRKYGIPPSHSALNKSHRDIVDKYLMHKKRQNLAAGTLRRHRREVERFLVFVESRGFKLAELTPDHMIQYIQQRGQVTRDTLSGIAVRLRIFLRYLESRELVFPELSLTIPRIRIYADAKIPQVWPREYVDRLIDNADRSDAIGKRDYVILLLAVCYGIRSGDITNLQLENIHWRTGEIKFVQQKTGKALQLPLAVDVGDGIIDYLQNARPTSIYRHLLLTCMPPITPLSPNGISSVVVRLLRRAGMELPEGCRPNLRSFRCGVATNMLKADISLATIASILGHTDLESIHRYLKVDIESLRNVCLDPEGM